jgi:hypothetical protein
VWPGLNTQGVTHARLDFAIGGVIPLQQGDVMLFPKALLHFQLNVGNETAIAFNTLTSQKPGLLLSSNQVRIVLSRVSFVSFCLLTQA